MKNYNFFNVTLPEALSKEDELYYFKKYRDGDLNAREILIKHNIRLVIHIIKKKFLSAPVNIEELISEGTLELIRTVDTFDYNINPNFSTYAGLNIEYKLAKVIKRSVSSSNIVSLDDRVYSNNGVKDNKLTYGDTIIDESIDIENDHIDDDMSDIIIKLIDEIKDDRERDIVKKSFGFGCERVVQTELAQIYNVSQVTISRILFNSVRTIAYKLDRMGLIHLNDEDKKRLKLEDASDILVDLKHEDTKYSVKDGVTRKYARKVKPFYSYFEGYSHEEVDKAVKYLNPKDLKLLHLKYGDKLDNPYSLIDGSSRESITVYAQIVPRVHKILRILKEQKENNTSETIYVYGRHKTLFEVFSEYSKDEIIKAVGELKSEDERIIYLMYGDNLDSRNPSSELTEKERNRANTSIKKILKQILEYNRSLEVFKVLNGVGYQRKIKTIYEVFSDCTRDEVNYAITLLPEDTRHLLYERYGNDLDYPIINNEFKGLNYQKFYSSLLPKMRRLLKTRKSDKEVSIINGRCVKAYKTIYELFEEYSHEEIDAAVSELNEEELRIVHLKYGNDLKNTIKDDSLTKEESKYFYAVIKNKIKTRLVRNRKNKENNLPSKSVMVYNDSENELNNLMTKDDYIKVVSFLKKMNAREMFRLVNPQDLIITSLRFGYVEDKYYSIKAISKFLGITEREVLESIKRTLDFFNSKSSEMKLTYKEKDNE